MNTPKRCFYTVKRLSTLSKVSALLLYPAGRTTQGGWQAVTDRQESNVFPGTTSKVAALTDDVTNSVARTESEFCPQLFAGSTGRDR